MSKLIRTGERGSTLVEFSIAATVFRGTVISVMALWFARLSEHERALQQHTRTLEGLLRICSFCNHCCTYACECAVSPVAR